MSSQPHHLRVILAILASNWGAKFLPKCALFSANFQYMESRKKKKDSWCHHLLNASRPLERKRKNCLKHVPSQRIRSSEICQKQQAKISQLPQNKELQNSRVVSSVLPPTNPAPPNMTGERKLLRMATICQRWLLTCMESFRMAGHMLLQNFSTVFLKVWLNCSNNTWIKTSRLTIAWMKFKLDTLFSCHSTTQFLLKDFRQLYMFHEFFGSPTPPKQKDEEEGKRLCEKGFEC